MFAVVEGDRPGRSEVYGVVRTMNGLQDYDLLSGPPELLDAVDEWVALYNTNELDRVAIFIDPE